MRIALALLGLHSTAATNPTFQIADGGTIGQSAPIATPTAEIITPGVPATPASFTGLTMVRAPPSAPYPLGLRVGSSRPL